MGKKQELIVLGRNFPLLEIEEVPIDELKPNLHNARKHPDKQILMLVRNIDTFGFLVPCLIGEDNSLLTGGARILAAKRLGMTTIPVVRIGHLTDEQKRAFVVADNKLAEHAVWDVDALRSELQFFSDLDLNFDFSVVGFETAEVDIILDDASEPSEHAPQEPHGAVAVTQPGDL